MRQSAASRVPAATEVVYCCRTIQDIAEARVMRASWAKFLALGVLLGGVLSCRTGSSEVKADDVFDGKKVGHWYEVLSFNQGDPYNFVAYHQNHKAYLLGNAIGPDFPEHLKGLWFMDGNPLGDKTIQFPRIYPSTAGNDFVLKVHDPTVFAWSNIGRSHTLTRLAKTFQFEYEFKWADCPEDVRREREEMWGMANGACTRADKQFATIVPYVKIGPLRSGVPKSALYFDMYLRPRQGDHLIWERRSRVLRPVQEFAEAFSRRDATGWHRYQLVQVMDKDGKLLQSYPKLIAHLKTFAAEQNIPFERMLFYKCYEGKTGCDAASLDQGDAQTEALFEGEDGAERFGTLPFM